MLLADSRRLTGRNLLLREPGAVIEVVAEPAEAHALAAATAEWRRQARRMLDAVGWRAQQIHVRPFRGGISLALSAPIDALYTATELNEWAWEAAVLATGPTSAAVAVASDRTAFTAAADRLRAAIARESDPALLALRDAAARHGVAFLADDDRATVGLGAGSRTWPRDQLPPPAAVEWRAVHDIPVALVTGTNGKTTTTRATAAILAAAGHRVGVTSTDGIAVGGDTLDVGDYSGPGGARTLLRDTRVQAAVLETARGGLLRRGLALERATAAAVTNIADDHLGAYGIDDLAGLAEAKLLVTQAVVPDGRTVLNADDPELAARGSQGPAPVTWFSLDPHRAAQRDLAAHHAAGGDAVFLEGGQLLLARGGQPPQLVAPAAAVPITFGGAARHNVANALAAIGLAAAMGAPIAAMAQGLTSLRGDDDAGGGNPGRGHLIEIDGFHALLDYAHNPHGLAALVAFAATIPATRRLIILGQAGDRDDESIRHLAQIAWTLHPDHVIIKELAAMLRGRLPGEVPALLETELLRLGARRETLTHAANEVEAVRQALAWARPGDLLLLLIHKQRDEALAILNDRRRGWA
jgi:cyanophycin synthetase